VGEERILAIPMMLAETEGLQAILLDDAFQHRYLKADGYILLTTFEKPFYKDHLLPVGRLREGRGNARRADVVVVTKCPDTITRDEKESMISNIKKFVPDEIPVFFAGLKYGTPYPLQQGGKVLSKNLILVTGIVDHKPMLNELTKNHTILEVLSFPDHHAYTGKDLQAIRRIAEKYREEKPAVITTEKDAVKFRGMKILQDLPVFVLPVEVDMDQQDEQNLLYWVRKMIKIKNAGVKN